MRDRFLKLSDRALHTHELLEMLLFYSIPYRDTKPLAKTLLNTFGSLIGVIDAPKEELTKVSGVGKLTADLISSVRLLCSELTVSTVNAKDKRFDDYNEVGEYFVKQFDGKDKYSVLAVFLDSNMHHIATEALYELDCESAGVRADKIVKAAVMHNASTVIIAHNHPRGPIYPSEGDRATNELIERALNSIDVGLAEHYVVANNRYLGFMHHVSLGAFSLSDGSSENRLTDGGNKRYDPLLLLLSSTNTVRDPISDASNMRATFGTLRQIFHQNYRALVTNAAVSKDAALLIRLVVSIISRAGTDGFAFGKDNSEAELISYLSSLYFGTVNETVYLIGYDKCGRVSFVEYLCEGSVNSSSISTRTIIEKCMEHTSAFVSIAHNHPGGSANFSEEDRAATATLASALLDAGIRIRSHYLICGYEYAKLDIGNEYVN